MSAIQTDTQRPLHLAHEIPQADEPLQQEVRDLAARFGTGREALIPLLRGINSKRGHIPSPALDEIARVLGMDYAKVHRVASFYTQLDSAASRLPLAS